MSTPGKAPISNRLAAHSASTAGRRRATHRYALAVLCRRSARKGEPRSAEAGIAAIGLDRWAQSTDRRRWFAGSDDNRKNAAELVALAPDLIFATGAATLGPLLQATRTIPVVFTIVPDPVGSGYVASLARPGGNA